MWYWDAEMAIRAESFGEYQRLRRSPLSEAVDYLLMSQIQPS